MTDPLDKFRRAAKALKIGYEAGATDALARIAAVRRRRDGAELRHADYLHVIARETDFATWPAMKGAIETLGVDRAQNVQRLKIALHNGRTGRVAKLIEDTPDLATQHFGLLCALYDVDAVHEMLGDDPTHATKIAGPHLPMVHLCRSRMFTVWPDQAANGMEIAKMLVAHGADINLGSCEQDDPLSPLYWVLGHAGNMALATWLLEHGADPNDGESLYHATELGHLDGLRLLLSHGANPKGTNAVPRALDFDDADMVGLLLDAGADPNEGADCKESTGGDTGIPALHQAARRMSSAKVIDLLIANGADMSAIWNGHSVYAFAKVFGNIDLVQRIEVAGQTCPLSDIEQMLAGAASGEPVHGYIDTAKLPPEYRGILREILHLPNKLPHLKALVAIGLEWDHPDASGVTPVQAAGWCGLVDVMGYFVSLRPNLGHVNGHGGTLLSTILHGGDHNPKRAAGDYIGCLRLALEHGVALPRKAISTSRSADIRAFLAQWANDVPGQVVDHGIG